MGSDHTVDWKDAVLSILKGSDGPIKVKKLRKTVLLSLQLDDSDKASKKAFKSAVQGMEEEGDVKIDAEGMVKLKKKKRKKDADGSEESPSKLSKKEDEPVTPDISPEEKNKPCKGNPQGVTRLFLGNLPFAVDEASLESFLPASVTHIKWITDKETGKFYGSAFIEMSTSVAAADAVAMAGSQLMGRPIKINFAPSRPGDVWPPTSKVISGGGATTGGQAGGKGIKAMSEKPENCTKLFVGNLSYEIDDEGITKFFASVDAELKAVRWIHHTDSGDFKGVGFVEFWNTEACEKAATLNGKNLLGRPIRIDWTD